MLEQILPPRLPSTRSTVGPLSVHRQTGRQAGYTCLWSDVHASLTGIRLCAVCR